MRTFFIYIIVVITVFLNVKVVNAQSLGLDAPSLEQTIEKQKMIILKEQPQKDGYIRNFGPLTVSGVLSIGFGSGLLLTGITLLGMPENEFLYDDAYRQQTKFSQGIIVISTGLSLIVLGTTLTILELYIDEIITSVPAK